MKHFIQLTRTTARSATVLLLAILTLAATPARAEETDGFTLDGNTYTIHTAEGWNAFSDLLNNSDEGTFSDRAITVNLGADITDADPIDFTKYDGLALFLNLNGYTISGNSLYFDVGILGSLDINGGGQNGSIGKIISGAAKRPVIINYESVTLRNVNITTNYKYAINNYRNLHINENVSFNGWTERPYLNEGGNISGGYEPFDKVVASVEYGSTTRYFENSGAAATYMASNTDFDSFTTKTAEGWNAFCDLLDNSDEGTFSDRTITVNLGADITDADPIDFTNYDGLDLYLNLNGYTISGNRLYFDIRNFGTLIIDGGGQNGSIGNIISGADLSPVIQNEGSVDLRNVNITTNYKYAIDNYGDLIINENVSFNGWTERPYLNEGAGYIIGGYEPFDKVVASVEYGSTTRYFENSSAAATYMASNTGYDTYIISNARGWNAFCDLLDQKDKGLFSGKTVKLGADIGTAQNPVTRMAGRSGHEFTGNLDGQGHTLTVSYGSASAPVSDEDNAAPFRNVEGGSLIQNLHVAGDIYTTTKYAGGLVGTLNGNVGIANCHVSTVIHSFTAGEGSHGGFVGRSGDGNGSILTIMGCLFDGKLLTEGETATTNCGGIVGNKGNRPVATNYMIYAPAALADGEKEIAEGSYTFVHKSLNGLNCYYTRPLGTAQGKAAHTISAGDNVTMDVVLSDVSAQYNVSGITTYDNSAGLKLGETLYYGSGDEVSLTLSSPDLPAGYEYADDRYTPSAGTLSGNATDGYTLAMPDADVTISLGDYIVIDWAIANAGSSSDPYMIYNKDQLNLLAYRVNGTHGQIRQNNGYKDKYFKLGDDIEYTHKDANALDADTEDNYEAIGGNYESEYRYFSGNFDGNNKTISGIRIYRDGTGNADSYQGIFGYVSSSANIHGIRLANARITGYKYVGGIVGYNNIGKVADCHVASDVCINAVKDNANNHGGIVGNNIGAVNSCTSAATLTIANNATSWYYGGIVGYNNSGTMTDNLAIGANIPTTAYIYGAIVGHYSGGTLKRNYYTACTIAGVDNTTNVGSGNSADVTDNDAAVPALRDKADATGALALMAKLPEGTYPASFKRTFTAGKASTLCLPFAMSSIQGGKVYQLRDVTYDESQAEWVATMIDQSPEAGNLLTATEAGKPYLFMPESSAPVTFVGEFTVTEQTADDGFAPTDAEGNDDWTMKGTYKRLEYASNPEPGATEPQVTGAIFGFASTDKEVDGVQVNAGEFVRAMDGAAVPALRAYLTYSGSESALKTRGLRTRSIDTLPESITVQLIGKDGTVTAIGTLNTDSGQFRIDTDAWYTLGGRRLPAKPTTPGIYINGGQKVVIN